MNRAEVLANRRKWIDYLMDPKRKKTKGSLDDGYGHRCCLGHACVALSIKQIKLSDGYAYGEERASKVAPLELMQGVGLYDNRGVIPSEVPIPGTDRITSLTRLNDATEWSPQRIGEYLENHIEGGPYTPFKSIEEYPE